MLIDQSWGRGENTIYRIHEVVDISYTEQLQNIWVSECPPYFDLSLEALREEGEIIDHHYLSCFSKIPSHLLCRTALFPGVRKGHLAGFSKKIMFCPPSPYLLTSQFTSVNIL
jgi:hypothetical protein